MMSSRDATYYEEMKAAIRLKRLGRSSLSNVSALPPTRSMLSRDYRSW